ncbi:MAG: restriction endonuclease subunit S [Actinobacteria bacterium]|nr:restriction endonuclease subunit S [Actinomycetota bacterium]
MTQALKSYPAMKDSGVPWLGEVPEHWEVVPIGRMGQLFKGNGGSKEDEVPAGVPCVRYGSLYTRREFFIRSCDSFVTPERAAHYTPILYGDVLFAASGETVGEIGKSAVNLIESGARCGGDVIVFRPNGETVPRFLGYAADSPPSILQKACMGRGFTVIHIYAAQLKRLTLAVPPLPEQAVIVRFLDYADRRIHRYIRAKQKLIELLEEQKQAIIHRAVTRGLDPGVRLKPSGVAWLGDVPEHWEVKRLKYVSPEITVGVVVNPSSYFVDAGIPMLLGNNVLPGRFRLDNVRMISPESNRMLRKSQLHAGDVVVVRVGAPGVAAMVPDELDACNCASMVIVRRGREVEPRWVEHLFNSPVMRRQIDAVKYGAAQKQFNIAHAVEFWVLAPGLKEQREILDYLAHETNLLDIAAHRTTREIALLREYRTRLIADVVTGKLDVREAAALLPDEVDEPEQLDDADGPPDDNEVGGDAVLDGALEEVEA